MNDRPPLIVILVWGLLLVTVLVAVLFLVAGFVLVIAILLPHLSYSFTPHVTHI
jgi:hypothetical protein